MTTSTWPKLTKAPIVEGLIDIRVERSPAVTMAALQSAGDELAADFPSRTVLHHWSGQIHLPPQASPSISTAVHEPDGLLLRSTDEKWVVQFRLDGFTVSRLQPYVTWADLKAKATDLWTRYVAAANPTKVTRVASRFINRVQIPVGEPFEHTFLTNFVIGQALPQAVAGYLLRVVIPFEEHQAVAIVTQSMEGNAGECLFDLDAFSERPHGVNDEGLWKTLDNLRDVKNRLFFGSLTEAALERFK